MSYAYKYLTSDDEAEIQADMESRDKPAAKAVDDALATAWEADHYAHSLLLAKATDEDEKKVHAEAMSTIEAALKAAGK